MDGITKSEFQGLSRTVRSELLAIASNCEWVRIGTHHGEDYADLTILEGGPLVTEPTRGDWVDNGYILRVSDLDED